jgi:hypothetical protein
MLPGHVIAQEIGGGTVEVAAVDAVASMKAVENPNLMNVAPIVQEKLKNVVMSL